MDKKTLLSFDKSAFFVVCVGLNLVFMVCVWGLIFDFAIFRAELQPRWRGFLPGFFIPLPTNDRFGVSQNRICQRSFERTFSNLGKSFFNLDFKYVSMSS